MYQIISFGSATEDVFMVSQKLKVVESDVFLTKKGLCLPLGSKVKADQVFFAMGGCGTNTAVTFARQGLKTAYLGKVGQDLAGQKVKEVLEQEGVSLEFLKETDQWPTSYSVVLSLPEVGRTIFQFLGASHHLTQKDIPFSKLKTKWFYLGPFSGENIKVFEPVISFAAREGIKVGLTPGKTQLIEPHLSGFRAALDKIDVLILNQEEAAQLTGLDFKEEKAIFKKLDDWVKGIVVMTKGPQGVVVSDGQQRYSAGIPQSGLVDRTGAGDAFASAFLSSWIEKEDIIQAIQLATANATAVLQQIGATNGLLRKGQWGPWEKVKVEISPVS